MSLKILWLLHKFLLLVQLLICSAHRQDKFSKYEALDMVASATNHAEAAQTMLELLAERTFSDISGQDLLELQKLLRSINDQLLQNRLMINRWALILAYC